MKLPRMHCRAAWALLLDRFRSCAVLFLILLRAVQTQTVVTTVPVAVLEGEDTRLRCQLQVTCCDTKCLFWSHMGPGDDGFQVGECSRDCGNCSICPDTQSEPCSSSTELYFKNTQRSCAAIYMCQDCGDRSYRVKLDVHYPPSKLTISDSSPTAIQGRPFELSCQMNDLGNPEADITWQPDTEGVITQGRGSSTIQFNSVDHRTMPREIKCYPTQDGGKVSEDALQNLGVSVPLEVYYPPESVQIQRHYTGDRLDLNCTVSRSNPPPTISWWRNGALVQEGDSTLSIAHVQQTDTGLYVCRARTDVPSLGVHWDVPSDPVRVPLESDAHITTTGMPSTTTTQHPTTAKTTEMAPVVAAGVQDNSSSKDHQVFTMAVIMSCAFGGVMFLCVVIIAAWVYQHRKRSPRTSQLQLQETGTSLSGEDNAPRQETSLPILLPEYSLETIDTGLTSDADPRLSAVGVPVQVSSIHPYLQEPNFNPIMVSLKTTTPQQRIGRLENTALTNGERTPTLPKVVATDPTPGRILRLNEETSPKDRPKATKRCNCKSASRSTSMERATRPKSFANFRQREDGVPRRSVSLDESTPSEPHTLCSSLPDSGSCPRLDEMISGKSTAKKEPEIQREAPKKEKREEKQSPSQCKEETGAKAGLVGSMETIEEDTAHILVKKKPPAGNQSGKQSLDVESLSLGGNKVATTIVQMIRKQLVVRGHLDLPYLTFSDLCLRLYNTGSNWKVLAGKLGLTVEDVELIDSCSAQHGLLAAEIVIRHWQRTADQDGTAPCNLRNLRGILTDMGRRDLVDMLKK
ncbi:uncharacterized protein LOC144907725 [Branchiostoma floridae x Branchiostoma belcheri]